MSNTEETAAKHVKRNGKNRWKYAGKYVILSGTQ